jgi:putative transcriptional regulator
VTKLQSLIKQSGLKQNYIADKIGISQTSLSLIARGSTTPGLKIAISIARFFNTTVEDLWGEEVG